MRAKNNHINWQDERGAALITAILVSFLVLALGAALLLTTNMSTTNAISSTDEAQAYYAAEAGLQDALSVLRGNVAPHPNDGTKMNFKNAINVGTSNNPGSGVPQLSRWLNYNYPSTGTANRVTLSPPPYTEADGLAYNITGISDPDDSLHVVYFTAGAFNGGTPTTSASTLVNIPNSDGSNSGITLTYTPQTATDITTNPSPSLGTLQFSGVKNNPPPPPSVDFSVTPTILTLQITLTSPSSASGTPFSVAVRAKLRGTITSTTSTVYLDFNSSGIEIPPPGVVFTPLLTASGTPPIYSLIIPADNTAKTILTAVSPGEPGRLIVKVVGYGPHGAYKNLQAMVTRFGLNFDPPAAFIVRGHDDLTTPSTIDIGSSAAFIYSGVDNSQVGQPLPAFLVTNSLDYATMTTLKTNNNLPITGDPWEPIRLVTLPGQASMLPSFLQTTSDPVSGSRVFVQQLRTASQGQFFGCSTGQDSSCDRYFNTRAGDAAPIDFGMSQPNGLFTFVDGDATLPSSGGRGLLVVTGTLYMNGNQPFEGLVLVLGDGVINRSGAGNGISLGAFVVARFGSTGGFLAPTVISSGTGTSTLQLDRNKVRSALLLGGVNTISVSEY
jgi:hypothetical protein